MAPVTENEKPGLATERAVRYFFFLALLNAFFAVAITAPILLPRFEFPIILTEWPGIYIILAYSSFIVGGVLGMIAWASGYYLIWRIFGLSTTSKGLIAAQILLTQAGTYSLTIFMYWGGFVGAHASHEGIAIFIIGQIMEFAVIPSALGIALILVGTTTGLLNILLMLRR
jgi:hypothetical protein